MASTMRFAVWALLVTAAASHEGHEEVEVCACAAAETAHPFTIDCADTSQIAAAETTLKTSGCQAVTAGTCATSSADATLTADTIAENCQAPKVFTLTDADACDAIGLGGVGNLMVCHKAFFILQAHHDSCEHDTLTADQEELVHDFEGACTACQITRAKENTLAACTVPADCEDPAPATAALAVLTGASCTGTARTAATCTETANAVTEDATACAGVTGVALATASACETLLTKASDNAQDDGDGSVADVAACTYAPANDACCHNQAEQDAYKVMAEYHALCHDEDVPSAVATALHTYEDACEEYGECNTPLSLVANYDPATCPTGEFWPGPCDATEPATGADMETVAADGCDGTGADAIAMTCDHECAAGYEGGSITCTAPTQSQSQFLYTVVACAACPSGKYSAGGDGATCTTWMHGAATRCAAGSDWTTGTASADSTCTSCPAGKSSATADADCTECASGSFSAAGAAECTTWTASSACTTGVYADGSTTADSTCTPWTHGAATDCAAGSDWTTGTTSADSTCTTCPEGKFSATADADCTTWTTATEAACQHTSTGTDAGDADGTGYTWTTGSATADSTCVTPALCSTGADITPTALACPSTVVADTGKTCAASTCVASDFADAASPCCKAKPAPPPAATSGAATAVPLLGLGMFLFSLA